MFAKAMAPGKIRKSVTLYYGQILYVRTTTTPQQHKQFSLTLLAEGTGCGTDDPE
jgi:hypothetical protein